MPKRLPRSCAAKMLFAALVSCSRAAVAPDAGLPAASSITVQPSASPAQPATLAPTVARPTELAAGACEHDRKPCTGAAQCVIVLARVIPEGHPLELVLEAKPLTMQWKYRADGRLLESPTHTFRHGPGSQGARISRKDNKEVAAKFDDRGRLVELGSETSYSYLPDGRIASIVTRARGRRDEVTYQWESGGKYAVRWTFPDAEEFCEPEPESVTLDARGRVLQEKYTSCQINYSPFQLAYEYDASGRITGINVECHPGTPEAGSHQLRLKYD